ncbi:MAG: nucleoside monophosphate kinase, partial [Candidatus Paceibacterota bacterium]
MIPQTFIFLGSSGCGKGTQLENVLKYLTLKDSQRKVVTLGMGDSFRTFWNEGGYTQAHSLEILKKGALQPSFIQIYLWTDFFVHNVTKETHLLVDGTPRRIEGSRAFDSALRFYSRVKPVVVYLKVSRQWAKKRLIERASLSDKPEKNNNLRNLEDGDD